MQINFSNAGKKDTENADNGYRISSKIIIIFFLGLSIKISSQKTFQIDIFFSKKQTKPTWTITALN